MGTEQITIQIDGEAAQAFKFASLVGRRKSGRCLILDARFWIII